MKPTKTLFAASPERPSLLELTWTVLRIACTTFASGSATIALLGRAYQQRNWLGQAQFDLCFSLSRAAPGTNVFAFVVAISWMARGWPGAIASLLALSIPSAGSAVAFTALYETWKSTAGGASAAAALLAAVVGIMGAGATLLIRPRLTGMQPVVILIGGLCASRWLSPLVIMLLAGVVGYFWKANERL